MFWIQRVRVRWGASARGAEQANLRRGLDRAVLLPAAPAGSDIVVHEVLADEAAGYERHEEVFGGGLERAGDAGFALSPDGVVERLPGTAAFPFRNRPARLFTLRPGETGRYVANFRFTRTTCACDPSWYYESWTVHIGNGPIPPDRFPDGRPDHAVDDRVHLYGGSRRPRHS